MDAKKIEELIEWARRACGQMICERSVHDEIVTGVEDCARQIKELSQSPQGGEYGEIREAIIDLIKTAKPFSTHGSAGFGDEYELSIAIENAETAIERLSGTGLAGDRAADALGAQGLEDRRRVTVCDKCLTAACWQGEFYCDRAKSAGITQLTVSECKRLKREHHSYIEKYAEPLPPAPTQEGEGR